MSKVEPTTIVTYRDVVEVHLSELDEAMNVLGRRLKAFAKNDEQLDAEFGVLFDGVKLRLAKLDAALS